MARDFGSLKTPDVLVSTIQKYIRLRPEGREYRAPCPFHSGGQEKNPSFTVVPEKGYFHCFGCGAHGDAIDFVMDYENVDKNTAYDIVKGERDASSNTAQTNRAAKEAVDYYDGITPLTVPEEKFKLNFKRITAYNPKRDKNTQYSPSAIYPYYDKQGMPAGYVLRVDIDAETKITPTIRWCKMKDGKEGWCHHPFEEPRPLYRHREAALSDRPVLVVEGEKAADAAAVLMGAHYDVVCWQGGSAVPDKADWSVLDGKKILLWPDADESGLNSMIGYDRHGAWKKGVGDLVLDDGAHSVRYIEWDKSKEKGWDAADALAEGWKYDDVKLWAADLVKPFVAKDHQPVQMPVPDDEPEDYNSDYEQYLAMESSSNVIKHPAAPAAPAKFEWRKLLMMKERDQSTMEPRSIHNASLYLQYEPMMAGVLAYNEMKHTIDIVKATPWDDNKSQVPRYIQDDDYFQARAWLEVNGLNIGAADGRAAVLTAAKKRKYNPLQNYLNNLEWDGVLRLEHWLSYYLGVPDSEYSYMVGRRFLIGAVARALSPGCKMDTMLILEGSQGVMKSTAIETLFGEEYYTDELHNLGSKDAAMQMQGRWVVEVAEMQAMNRAEANQIKEFTTRKVDKFRPPYGTSVIESPRTSVMIGTLNPEGGYLKDATGARRFWPVKCNTVDLKAIRGDRDQIWAEAVSAYNDGEKWWLEGDDIAIAGEEQEERYEGDSWAEGIDDYLLGKSEVTISDILGGLQIPTAQWTKQAEMRVGKHLRTLKWVRNRVSRGGSRSYVYKAP